MVSPCFDGASTGGDAVADTAIVSATGGGGASRSNVTTSTSMGAAAFSVAAEDAVATGSEVALVLVSVAAVAVVGMEVVRFAASACSTSIGTDASLRASAVAALSSVVVVVVVAADDDVAANDVDNVVADAPAPTDSPSSTACDVDFNTEDCSFWAFFLLSFSKCCSRSSCVRASNGTQRGTLKDEEFLRLTGRTTRTHDLAGRPTCRNTVLPDRLRLLV